MSLVFVKPKEGLIVRHPEKINITIPSAGLYVIRTKQIERLILSGDLIVVDKKEDTKSVKDNKEAPSDSVSTNTK